MGPEPNMRGGQAESDPGGGEHEDRARHHLEFATTVLLTIAAVATAWATYQSARWHGQQSLAQSSSIASRIESTRAADVANLQASVDIATFVQWIDARAGGDKALAAYYRHLFRGEFNRAVKAWLATHPDRNPAAPATPFAMSAYQLASGQKADRLLARSATLSQAVKNDIQRADEYQLAVVLFAVALFFAGISTRVGSFATRALVLGLGYLLFAGAVIWVATFPVTVAL